MELSSLAERFRNYLGFLGSTGFVTVDFEGFEDSDQWTSSLIVANHPSILDAILIMSRVPTLNCVANANLFENPIMSGAANLCDFVRNDSSLGMVRKCSEQLKAGKNILIFPEGTRTKTPPINPLFRSFVLIALKANVPIRTVLIKADSEYFGRGFYFFRPARRRTHFTIKAGKVFEPEGDAANLCREIEAYLRSSLNRP
jgi:1-acyl-sn-glycerol-3-phosphate acyltransferase